MDASPALGGVALFGVKTLGTALLLTCMKFEQEKVQCFFLFED